MSVQRVKARWNIPGAGTAFSVFHFGNGPDGEGSDVEASNSTLAVHTFFSEIKLYIPNSVSIDVQTDVELLDVATGALVGMATSASRARIVGTAGATVNFAAPAGVCVTWATAGIRTVSSKPRRVRGRTFIVPVAQNAWDVDGTLNNSALTVFNNAATGLRGNFSGQELHVYGRPGLNATPPGQVYAVTGHKITDQAAILRSRRS